MSLITDARESVDHLTDDAADLLDDAAQLLTDVGRSHRIRTALMVITVVGAVAAVAAIVRARLGEPAPEADTPTVPGAMLRPTG